MQVRAALVREAGRLEVVPVALEPPRAGEVLVRIRAAGVCHSDLHTLRGELRARPPLVLGHEGAGVVEAVGPGVTRVAPGDPVVINWLPGCRTCEPCLRGEPNLCRRLEQTTFQGRLPDGSTRIRLEDGTAVGHYLGSATMAEYTVVPEEGVVPLLEGVPFEVGAILGCAVVTGVGAVFHTARMPPGQRAAVIGCGGVGLSALLGCLATGAHTVIAVDTVADKLALARRLGATHTVHAGQEDVVALLRHLTDGGPDYVFDSVGAATTIRQALEAVRPGGTATLIGLHAALDEVAIRPGVLIFQNKTLRGSFAGSMRPEVDLPMLQRIYLAGHLDLDALITRRYPLEEIAQAFADMEAGRLARGVLVME